MSAHLMKLPSERWHSREISGMWPDAALCFTCSFAIIRLSCRSAAIAGPLTKMAMTVLEPAQVPGAFQQAFHLMRSGRPGPVLIDLPFDVQMTEIDFDPDTYEPLPVYMISAGPFLLPFSSITIKR
jgi:glyoxylate carboligase